MRIIDAESQLLSDILQEMEIVDSQDKDSFSVYVGRHETLGRMVVVAGHYERGVIIEMD